jgi:hypothetical protein
MTNYYGVIGNRDYIKLGGKRRPFWEFLDREPAGWLTSLAYARKDLPLGGKKIGDCGAWSYKDAETPRLGKHDVTPVWALAGYVEMLELSQADELLGIAPDHMLIPGKGYDLDARRRFNRESAAQFLQLVAGSGVTPMATAHGITTEERIGYALELVALGYRHIALGGLAGQASRKAWAVETVAACRAALPGTWLHVLGLSSPSYMTAWRALGVDSCDGSSHFKQAFTAGTFFIEAGGALGKYQAARPGELITAPPCDCRACELLRADGVDTRTYGSNETNMGRAAHNLNMLMRAHAHLTTADVLTLRTHSQQELPL